MMIQIKQLYKQFGQQVVLKGIDLSLNQGQVLCIIGPSGSGKSTLLRCINLLEIPTSGMIRIHQTSLDFGNHVISEKEKRALRGQTAMVFQNFNLFPHRTVLENVIEGPLVVKREKKLEVIEKATELLKKVGLSNKLHAYPAQLSGGQQQRVAIARALAMKPVLLLFDEPTSALDPELVGEVLLTIQELAEERHTMIIVTHEMEFAKEVADQVIFMDQGRMIEINSAKTFFTSPQEKRTQKFLAKILKR